MAQSTNFASAQRRRERIVDHLKTRTTPSLKIKLAAALLQLRDERGELLIPHEHAKLMTADQIISLFAFDHYPIRYDDGGPAEPWNLQPLTILAHRRKTAKIDIPQMRKADRLRKAKDALDTYLTTGEKPPLPKRKKNPSRPMMGTKASGFKKRMDGRVEAR